MKENKDKTLTYEEIIRKQEKYIKELEGKLRTPSDTKKGWETTGEPDYEELCRQVQSLHYMLNEERNNSDALECSLKIMYKEMNNWKNRSKTWEENYYKEYKRAEKLYDEWEELKRKNNEN